MDDRTPAGALERIPEYQPQAKPARLMLPDKRLALFIASLRAPTRCQQVNVDLLRSVVGVWIWGALLRREALSIPHAVFNFMDRFPEQWARWWRSARGETRAMAHAVPLLFYDAGAPLLETIFAADAQGANEDDHGGYGLVARTVPTKLVETCYCKGRAVGRTISRLGGDLSGPRRPDRPLDPSKPFSLLPPLKLHV